MEELNLSVETQEVAAPEIENTENTEATVEVETSVETQEVAKPEQQQRNFEKDSAYAKIRREAEALKKQNEMLAKTFEHFGFKGTTEEIVDQAMAHYLEKPIEEVKAERLAKEQESKLQAELNYYKEQEVLRLMNEDLKKIQKLDPTVKTLQDVDERYFKFIANGLDGESAFAAVQQLQAKEKKNPPAEVGKINSSLKVVKDYYSKEEVDKLTEAELEDPKVWARVRQSMTKWR